MDRPPGFVRHRKRVDSSSVFLAYDAVLGNGMQVDVNYGLFGVSNVLTRTGNKGGGEKLGGYTIHNVAATLSRDEWSLTLYVDNFTDKYAETAARSTSAFVQTVPDFNGDPVQQRGYFKNVLPPRQIGLRMTWTFES